MQCRMPRYLSRQVKGGQILNQTKWSYRDASASIDVLKFPWREKARTLWAEGLTTWWTSNIYSLGPAFRILLKIPRWVPLDMMSDHGVTFVRNSFVHELKREATCPPVYLSWFTGQVEHASMKLGGESRLTVLGCPHPWTAANSKYAAARAGQDGCLAYVPHSILGGRPSMEPIEALIQAWRDLPKMLQPTALCLSSHEILPETLAELERFGLPLLTAGNPNSAFFMDRFYSLRLHFKYSTSPKFGSEACYVADLGLDHFLYGDWRTGEASSIGVDNWQARFVELANEAPNIDLDLWKEADLVFRDTSLDRNARRRMSDHLLGKHFEKDLEAVRECLLVKRDTQSSSWRRPSRLRSLSR